MSHELQTYIITRAAVDRPELVVPQQIMRPLTVDANGKRNQWCTAQTSDRFSQLSPNGPH